MPPGVDAAFICVLDEMHKEVIVGLKPLGLHIMCEKPLATTLADCVEIYRAMLPDYPWNKQPERIFSIGHVLRYSPHNIMLRKLLLEDRVIGDVLSINHTEPVGWWHFTHSYVRYEMFLVKLPNKIANNKIVETGGKNLQQLRLFLQNPAMISIFSSGFFVPLPPPTQPPHLISPKL